jgi:hypothetical protein
MDYRKILLAGMNWIHLAQNRDQRCEHCSESWGSIKCWEVLEKLSDLRLLKKNSAPWNQLSR